MGVKLHLENVRLMFPNLWEAKAVNNQGEAKFSASFVFPPTHPAVATLVAGMKRAAEDQWPGKGMYEQVKAQDRLALHDGITKQQYAGYEGMLFLNASNKLRPVIVAGDKTPLVAQDGKPYSGCYVNAIIELWAQDNQYGKRINASLMGVQFARDGERLSGGAVASEDDFEVIPGSEPTAESAGDNESSGAASLF